MSPDTLEALRARIRRTEIAAREAAAQGHEQTHTLEDGTTHHYTINGIKSPEQLEDELLTLFIWIWSLKDHLKERCKAKHLNPQFVEDVVNQSTALQYVADIANRAKHGVLGKSRSGTFAELVGVGWTVPQLAIAKISIGALSVEVDVAKPEEVELQAFVQPRNGETIDAFLILGEAIDAWEVHVIRLIGA